MSVVFLVEPVFFFLSFFLLFSLETDSRVAIGRTIADTTRSQFERVTKKDRRFLNKTNLSQKSNFANFPISLFGFLLFKVKIFLEE